MGSEGAQGASLDVGWSVDGDHLLVVLSGEIDSANAFELPALIASRPDLPNSVRVDLGGVTFLDSSLLQALVICQSDAAARNGDLKVRNPTEQARRIFEVTCLSSVLLETP